MKQQHKPVASETAISFSVPLVPPSANHYLKHTRLGHHYLTDEAKTFYEGVWVHCGRRKVRGKRYEVSAVIYLGKGQRGDTDNFAKVIGDGLEKAGVIDTDSKIAIWHLSRLRDPLSPRTVITVSVI